MMKFPCVLLLLALPALFSFGCGGGGSSGPSGPVTDVGYLKAMTSAAGRVSNHGIATFADGSAVVVGEFSDTATFGAGDPVTVMLASAGNTDIFVARYAPNGELQWAKRAGGTIRDLANGVAAFADGSCVVTGKFEDVSTFGPGETNQTLLNDGNDQGDVFVARYNADGTLAWARRGGGSGNDSGSRVATFADGACVVAGRFQTTAVFGPTEPGQQTLVSDGSEDIFIARYEVDGDLLWAKRAGGMFQDIARGIDSLADGSCLIVSDFGGTATFGPGDPNQTVFVASGPFDVCLARYDANGALTWAKRIVTGPSFDEAYGVSAFPDGGCVVGGFFRGGSTFGEGDPGATTFASITASNDAYLARFAPDGSILWARHAGGAASGDNFRSVAAFADGSCAAAGSFAGLALYNIGQADQLIAIGRGGSDAVVARYGANGDLLWLSLGAGALDNVGFGVAAHADGSVGACGTYEVQATFNAGQASAQSLTGIFSDGFIARYNTDGSL